MVNESQMSFHDLASKKGLGLFVFVRRENMVKEQKLLQQFRIYIDNVLYETYGVLSEQCIIEDTSYGIFIYIKKWLSPIEKTLYIQKEEEMIGDIRQRTVETVFIQMKDWLCKYGDIRIEKFIYDWNIENETMCFLLFSEEETGMKDHLVLFQQQVVDEILQHTNQYQKKPDYIEVLQPAHDINIVVQYGILLPLEQTLVNKGYKDLVINRQMIMKQYVLQQQKKLESIIQREIQDIFIAWHYELNRCYIIFFHKKRAS